MILFIVRSWGNTTSHKNFQICVLQFALFNTLCVLQWNCVLVPINRNQPNQQNGNPNQKMEIQTNQPKTNGNPTARRGQAALRKIDPPLKKTPTDAAAENVCKKTQINSIVQTKPTNQTVQGKRSQTN